MVSTAEKSFLSRRQSVAEAPPSAVGSTERVRKLHSLLLSTPHTLCLHRARAYTRVFRETEGEPVIIRRARAFARALQDLPAEIYDGELLVGIPACRMRAASFFPEVQAWLRKDIDTLATREQDPFRVTSQQIAEAKELMAYWEGKTLFDLWSKACPLEIVTRVSGTGWALVPASSVHSNGYHFVPPFEVILSKGIVWYEGRVREALERLDPDDLTQIGKAHFYQALLIAIAAVRDFSGKYAGKALELAEKEKDPERKEELRRIAEIAERVPYHGARSFHEALQAVSFMMALVHIEGTGPAYSLGRVDQYLYPFYQADVAQGRITPQQAQELIELLFLKLTGIIMLWSNDNARSSPGYRPSQAISLGGVDAAGKDASNELTYLFLEAAASVRTIQPDIAFLWSRAQTPYRLKLKAAELNALGLGVPKLFDTEIIKLQLMDLGYSLEEARVGWIQGCTEQYGPGCQQQGHSAGCYLNLGLALEAVLNNGRKRMPGQPGSGELLGVETGDPRQFRSFDEFLSALKTQIARQIRDGHIASCWVQWLRGQHFPLLLESVFTDACIERGLTAHTGGAKVNVGPGFSVSGAVGTVADSLAAVRKLVFEEKKVSMAELLTAIEADFKGYESLQNMLIHQAPKYGNDDDYVDDLAREIWQFVADEAKSRTTTLGNRNNFSTSSPMSNIPQGTRVWATPDGRKAGAPFSNHVSPMDGRDVNGPIANINSVTKLGIDRSAGAILNMYLVNINSEDDWHKIVDLAEAFFTRGGSHLQLNCQDKKVFIDAQKHPERYAGLMVRVAGYVAYFVELPKVVQNQIIGRTDQHA